jgi:hypothetical protein
MNAPEDQKSEERDGIKPWRLYLSHDFGVAAPSVTFVCAVSPGAEGPDGKWYPRNSVVLVDELATNEPGHLNKGLGWTVPRLAEAITELAERWHIRPRGVADDACFARSGHGAGSIATEFSSYGVFFDPAKKGDRRSGWERMRRMLEAAGSVDSPRLYISRRCEYLWETLPYIARDPKRVDDVDSRGPDHGCDAARYSLLEDRATVRAIPIKGMH